MQNQSKREITFDTQLKTVLIGLLNRNSAFSPSDLAFILIFVSTQWDTLTKRSCLLKEIDCRERTQ